MTFFGQIGSGFGLFVIALSLLNGYYALRVAGNLRHRWADYQEEPLKAWQKETIDRAAFFLGVPLGVIVHELAHALTVWLFGGQVVDVGYGLYWGYVAHTGFYTPVQSWIISLSGTIGSLIYGVFMWLIFRRLRISSYQFFALRILRVHLTYSLIFYPIFTLVTFVGDWRVIYDFQSTPILSGITLIIHIGSLAILWKVDRRGMFEMPAFETVADKSQFAIIRKQAEKNPHDTKSQLRVIDAYRRSGMIHTANHQTTRFLRENQNSAVGYLLQALLAAGNKRQVPKKSHDSAMQALRLGLETSEQVSQANLLAGQYALGVSRLPEAITFFSHGIDAAESANQSKILAQLYYLRATAFRQSRDYTKALADIEKAIDLSQVIGDGRAMSLYESERKTIKEHSGLLGHKTPRDSSYHE